MLVLGFHSTLHQVPFMVAQKVPEIVFGNLIPILTPSLDLLIGSLHPTCYAIAISTTVR